MTRIGIAALLCLAVVCFFQTDARAGACPNVGQVMVNLRSPAPTNVQIRLTFTEELARVYDLENGSSQIIKSTEVAADDAVFILRLQGTQKQIATTTRRFSQSALPMFLLVPDAPLKPNSEYELALLHKDQSFAFNVFRTGSSSDAVAPKLERVRRPRFRRRRHVRHWKDSSGPDASIQLVGVSNEPGLEVEIHDLSLSESAGPETLRATQSIYPGPKNKMTIRFGKVSSCGAANFIFPARVKGRRVSLPLGVRVVDTAGNKGTIHSFNLPLD